MDEVILATEASRNGTQMIPVADTAKAALITRLRARNVQVIGHRWNRDELHDTTAAPLVPSPLWGEG